jgi:hypothetical protein
VVIVESVPQTEQRTRQQRKLKRRRHCSPA